MKRIVPIIVLLMIQYNCFAQTVEFSGDISLNTEWDYDTLKITGDVKIISGVTLTVSEGTYVEFQGDYQIASSGSLKFMGTPNNPIIFTTNDSTKFDSNRSEVGWGGIKMHFNWDGGNYGDNNSNDSTILENCIFEYSRNGALSVENFSKIRISNCIFRKNYASEGAGINLYHSNPLIYSCSFYENYSYNSGGALNLRSSSPEILSSSFIDNHGSQGGAINITGNDAFIANNIFSYNTTYNGGAIKFHGFNGILANNIIFNNRATYGGGAIYGGSGKLVIINNTICNNSSNYAPGIYVSDDYRFYNTIFWGNGNATYSEEQIYLSDSRNNPIVRNCVIEDGEDYDISLFESFENVIFEYPNFQDSNYVKSFNRNAIIADWSVDSTSVCVDQGYSSFSKYEEINLIQDISDNKRVSNCIIDIGALEFQFDNSHPVISDADFSIDENTITSSFVGKVMASNPGNDELHFEIVSGNSLGAFQIDFLTGEITVADSIPLDFETNPVFELHIQVSDCEFSVIGIVTVTLNDVDDMVLGILDQQRDIVKLYPNPVNSFVTIEWDDLRTAAVFDLSGKELIKADESVIDLRNLKAGIYLITLRGTNNQLWTFRIVKE